MVDVDMYFSEEGKEKFKEEHHAELAVNRPNGTNFVPVNNHKVVTLEF